MLTAEETGNLVKSVSGALRKYTSSDFGAEILIDVQGIHEDEQGWRVVPVYPSRDLDKVYYYYDILAKAEEELQNVFGRIMLVPTMPRV